MFDLILEDQGLVHRLKELKAYYKQKDDKKALEKQEVTKAKDSILKKVFKIYPGM
jgi:hypothetical protein